MTDRPKPEGPIYIDFTTALYNLPIPVVLDIANHALNKLSMRDLGEISYHTGAGIHLCFMRDLDEPDEVTK